MEFTLRSDAKIFVQNDIAFMKLPGGAESAPPPDLLGLKEVHHLKQLKICVITSTLDTQTWGSKNRQKTENSLSGHVQSCLNMSNFLTIFLGTERHLIKDEKKMGIRSCKFSDLNFSEIMAKMESLCKKCKCSHNQSMYRLKKSSLKNTFTICQKTSVCRTQD